jgi:hypothetical protein
MDGRALVTDLKARKTAAHGTDDRTMKSFHSPPVAQAIIGITHIPEVQPTNCSIVISALCEVDDISIPATIKNLSVELFRCFHSCAFRRTNVFILAVRTSVLM